MDTWSHQRNAERVELAIEVLQRAGFLRLGVRGTSMLPSLWPGDEVEIASCRPAELKVGMIALAYRGGRLYLHRVIKTGTPEGVVLCGDSMPKPDPLFPLDAMLGRVVRVRRDGRPIGSSGELSMLNRCIGLLFCYGGFLSRLGLRLQQRRQASRKFAPGGLVSESATHELHAELCELQRT